MYANLKNHLFQHLEDCYGNWIKRKSGYEAALCSALDIELDETRYQDATWGPYSIELKKGTLKLLFQVETIFTISTRTPQTTRKTISLFFASNIISP